MAVSLVSRIITPILLLVGTFCFGILPIGLRRTLLACDCSTPTCKTSCRARRGKIITSFLIYLGGGVLLATCLIHLLPEAREGFEAYQEYLEAQKELESNESSKISFGSLILNRSFQTDTEKPHLNDTEDSEDEQEHKEHFPMPEFVVCLGFFAVYAVEEILHYLLGGHQHIPTETRAIRSLSRSNSCQSPDAHETKASGESIAISTLEYQNVVDSTDGLCPPSPETKGLGFSVSGLLTVAALSFHSLFEGFAIGLQDTDKGIWILFAAISVHKFVIAFVVGLEALANGSHDLLVAIYMVVFAFMSPLGMVAAIITETNIEDSSPLVVGILNAIATGTLLYVTFCEILQRDEEHNNLEGWQQFLATLIGFSVMCIVQYGSTLA